MRYFLLVALLTIAASAASAQTYQWTDKGGGLHFTDDPDNIPPSYRNRAKEIDVEPPAALETPPAETPPASASEGSTDKDGHDEQWWRFSYRSLREEIRSIEEGLPDKRERLNELRRKKAIYSKPSDRVAYYALMDEIKSDENRIAELRKQLSDLDIEASKAGVPFEWRN
jgi:hypothetical protein